MRTLVLKGVWARNIKMASYMKMIRATSRKVLFRPMSRPPSALHLWHGEASYARLNNKRLLEKFHGEGLNVPESKSVQLARTLLSMGKRGCGQGCAKHAKTIKGTRKLPKSAACRTDDRLHREPDASHFFNRTCVRPWPVCCCAQRRVYMAF